MSPTNQVRPSSTVKNACSSADGTAEAPLKSIISNRTNATVNAISPAPTPIAIFGFRLIDSLIPMLVSAPRPPRHVSFSRRSSLLVAAHAGDQHVRTQHVVPRGRDVAPGFDVAVDEQEVA